MTNKSKRVLMTVMVYIFLVMNFTVEDSFIVAMFAYIIYWLFSSWVSYLVFRE